MARPQRNTVDYFPHLIGDGKKMFFIEQKYGNDGYATWFKLLELLACTENHFLNLNNEQDLMFTAAKCRVSEDVLISIITDLSKLGIFDSDLWSSRVVWCQIFIDSIQDAYSKRSNKCLTLEGLRGNLEGLGILKGSVKPQSKVKETKEDKTKEEKSRFIAPPIEEMVLYFVANGYTEESAKKAWNYYSVADWKDSKGNKVKNWKQKSQAVWFKEENKIGNGKSDNGSNGGQLAPKKVDYQGFGTFT